MKTHTDEDSVDLVSSFLYYLGAVLTASLFMAVSAAMVIIAWSIVSTAIKKRASKNTRASDVPAQHQQETRAQMKNTHSITPVPHESPTLIDYSTADGTTVLTLDTETMRATSVHLQDTVYDLGETEPDECVLDLSNTKAATVLGSSPWMIHSLDTNDVRQIISIASAGVNDGALGYLMGVLERPAQRATTRDLRGPQLRALRAGLSVDTEHRVIEEPETALYVAHANNSVNGNEDYMLYLTAPENPYGNPDVAQHTSRHAPSHVTLLICEPVGDITNRVLAQLDWPLVSTAMPENQRALDALAESPVLIEQLILAAHSDQAEDAQRMVTEAQSRLGSQMAYALSSLVIINYPESESASGYGDTQKSITITPSEHVIGKPARQCDIVTCYPESARYLLSLERLRRHGAALARAIDKEKLTEAVAQTQWLHEEQASMSESRFRAALSDICCDLIQEAAETLEA